MNHSNHQSIRMTIITTTKKLMIMEITITTVITSTSMIALKTNKTTTHVSKKDHTMKTTTVKWEIWKMVKYKKKK